MRSCTILNFDISLRKGEFSKKFWFWYVGGIVQAEFNEPVSVKRTLENTVKLAVSDNFNLIAEKLDFVLGL